MRRVTREWEALRSFLPEGWEEAARETGAICRTRKVSSAEELLRVELLHFGEGLSLKETSIVAKEGEISDISSVALYKRARKSGEWLQWICEHLLEKLGTQTTPPEWLNGRRIRAIDGSHISEQGSTGSDWILHYSWDVFGLRNDFFEITSCKEGESALRYAVGEGDIILADRHYGKARAFDYITANKGDYVMRLKHKAADYYDVNGRKTDLLPLLESIGTGEVLDVPLYYKSDRKVASPLKPIRICAIRKSAEQIAHDRRSTLRNIKKYPHKKPIDPNTLRMNEYFVVGTSLREEFSAAQILHIYRLRWQVEIAFKRLKSIMQLGQLPKTDPESCRAWRMGKCCTLCCAMQSSMRAVLFPHGGICSKYLERHESLWRELSVSMLLVSQAVRPFLGIRHAITRWETIAVALAERPRRRVNMIAVSM